MSKSNVPALFADPEIVGGLPNPMLALLWWETYKPIFVARNEQLIGKTHDEIDAAARAAIVRNEVSKVSLAGEEKILKAIVNDNLDHAGRMIRELLKERATVGAALDEAVTGRRRQAKHSKQGNAKKAEINGLRTLINKMVKDTPDITQGEVIANLEREIGRGIVRAVSGERVEWRDGAGKVRTKSWRGIRDILTRARRS
jgi:hypothetical protein